MARHRSISWVPAFAIGAAWLATVGVGGPPAAGRPPTAVGLVRAFNARPLGSPGLRRVRLDLRSGAATTRSFGVVHAWREAPDTVTSLVFLQEPKGLAGTSYLLSESEHLPTGLAVFLRLRLAGPRVLAIESGRFDEGLLGSDFSYRDLLWRIPVAGRSFALLGRRPLGSAMAWVIESRPVTAAVLDTTAWARVEYYLSPETLLLGADYYGHSARSTDQRTPSKTLRVFGWAAHGDVWSPSRMIMTRPGGRRSVMTLSSLKVRVAELDRMPFTPPTLTRLGEQFEAGPPPAVFDEDHRDRR